LGWNGERSRAYEFRSHYVRWRSAAAACERTTCLSTAMVELHRPTEKEYAILAERYAAGEIGEVEFEERLATLKRLGSR
jgi:hypothetical protein